MAGQIAQFSSFEGGPATVLNVCSGNTCIVLYMEVRSLAEYGSKIRTAAECLAPERCLLKT